jgi:acetolactate synthase-1/3 small subunit
MSDSVRPTEQRHVLSILVEDRFGELARIVGLFSGRGFNIDSLAVNRTTEPGMSRVILVTRGDEKIIEQINKQLNKLIRVHKVKELSRQDMVERELCLVTVRGSSPKAREEIERLTNLTHARVITYSANAFTLEVTGTSKEVDNFLEVLRPLGIKDMVRTAPVAVQNPAQDVDAAAESAA